MYYPCYYHLWYVIYFCFDCDWCNIGQVSVVAVMCCLSVVKTSGRLLKMHLLFI